MLSKLYSYVIGLPGMITPSFVQRRIDPERFGIDRFMYGFIVNEVSASDMVLDAGAGSGRYRNALAFTKYQATDFEDIFDAKSKTAQDFVCSLDDIPKPDNTYDAVVNMQVLEHVEYPQKVINELYRVLKPGGKLFLTTPQMWAVHGAPYNFFFYTRYGLESLFRNAGFDVVFIRPRGGVFWVLGKMLATLPGYIFYQLAFTGFKKDIRFKPRPRSALRVVLLTPIYLITQIFVGTLLPFVLFYLDRLDRQKDFTLGYECYCTKPR